MVCFTVPTVSLRVLYVFFVISIRFVRIFATYGTSKAFIPAAEKNS